MVITKVEKDDLIAEFEQWIDELPYLEKSRNTELAYRKAVDYFLDYLKGYEKESVDKLAVIGYKNNLLDELRRNENKRRYKGVGKINTVNFRLTVINRILNDLGYPDLRVKLEKDTTSNVQTDVPNQEELDLILKKTKELKKDRLGLLIKTLSLTGMRISELKFLTREALNDRYFSITNKGKTRYVFIPKKLNAELLKYCRKNKIKKGIIFHGREPETLLDQSYIRKEMKNLAWEIDKSLLPKLHPHAFRKFFARLYSTTPEANAFWLPDILGHSNSNITAYYAKGDIKDYLKAVDKVEEHYYEVEKINKQNQKKPTRRRKLKKKR